MSPIGDICRPCAHRLIAKLTAPFGAVFMPPVRAQTYIKSDNVRLNAKHAARAREANRIRQTEQSRY